MPSSPLKKNIKIVTVSITAVAAGVSVFAFLLFRESKATNAKAVVASTMVLEVFERRLLTEEYIRTTSVRAKEQWFVKQAELEARLAANENSFGTPEEIDAIARFKTSLRESKNLFSEMTELYGATTVAEQGFREQKAAILASQLSVKAQELISAANDLREENDRSAAAAADTLILLFSLAEGIFFLVLGLSFWEIWRGANVLDRQKSEIEKILTGIGDGVIAIDRSWNIRSWNRAAADLSGWSAEEVLGKPFRDFVKFIREKDRKENIAFIEETMLFGKVHFMESNILLVRKDGTEIPVGDSASPTFDAHGIVDGAIVIFRNVAGERESQLLKSDFAYASHQLNTPVSKSLWSIEQALSESDPDRLKSKLAIAYQSAKSTEKLVHQLFVVSELDKGFVVPILARILPGEVFESVRQQVENDTRFLNVRVDFDLSPEVPTIAADAKLLKQALYEIVKNAIDYSKPGSHIRVQGRLAGSDLLISISDSGIGIPIEQQALVYTKFFRGNNFNTTDIIGAGLGLFVAREYIHLMKGKIWFESKEGEGTIFYVSLPLADAPKRA